MVQPTRLALDTPGPFLGWLDGNGARFDFGLVEVAEIWSPADVEAQRFVVELAVEDTGKALEFASKHLLPRLTAKKPDVLDFRNIPILTQSFLHALPYEPLRVGWALKTAIWVVNAKPAVRSNLELLQNYALGG